MYVYVSARCFRGTKFQTSQIVITEDNVTGGC